MKLRSTHRTREPRLRTVEAVRAEKTPENLNTRIGIDALVKRRMLLFETFGQNAALEKAQTVIHLLTLFPEEVDVLNTLIPVDTLNDLSEGDWDQAKQLEARDLLTRLGLSVTAPSKEFTRSIQKTKTLTYPQSSSLSLVDLKHFNQVRQIWKGDPKPQIGRRLDEWVQTIDWGKNVQTPFVFLHTAQEILRYQPEHHPMLHQMVLAKEELFRQTLKKELIECHPQDFYPLISLFATFKLLLAEEIQVTPNGLLLAVEAGPVDKGTPLPARDVT